MGCFWSSGKSWWWDENPLQCTQTTWHCGPWGKAFWHKCLLSNHLIAKKVEKSEKKPPRIHESMKIREKTKNHVLRAARATDQWTHLCRQSVAIGSETMQTNSLRSGQLRPRIQGTGQRPSSSSAQLLVTGGCFQNLEKKASCKVVNTPFLINHSIPFLFFACCWEYHRGPPAKDCRSFPGIQIHKVQQKSN